MSILCKYISKKMHRNLLDKIKKYPKAPYKMQILQINSRLKKYEPTNEYIITILNQKRIKKKLNS
jgi:hypothetical protein